MKNTRLIVLLFATTAMKSAFAALPPDAVAEGAMTRLRSLVTSQNYAQMGFHSSNEVLVANVEKVEFDLHLVRLDKLATYTAAINPQTLLEPSKAKIYPVSVHRESRCSITLGLYPGGWRPAAYGYPGLAKLLTDARSDLVTATHLAPEKFFAVKVPALNLAFLGFYRNQRLMLHPLVDEPIVMLTAGGTKSAEQIFLNIVPLAQKQDPGLPR